MEDVIIVNYNRPRLFTDIIYNNKTIQYILFEKNEKNKEYISIDNPIYQVGFIEYDYESVKCFMKNKESVYEIEYSSKDFEVIKTTPSSNLNETLENQHIIVSDKIDMKWEILRHNNWNTYYIYTSETNFTYEMLYKAFAHSELIIRNRYALMNDLFQDKIDNMPIDCEMLVANITIESICVYEANWADSKEKFYPRLITDCVKRDIDNS
jgi:hypothetical protein